VTARDFAHGQTPYRKDYKLAGSLPPFWGFTVSAAFQSNEPLTASRRMTATRGATRYPANCPSPCPAGQVIMPSTVFYQPTLTFNLVPESSVFVERITQLDFKVTRTFKVNRISLIPTFEVFNINNSDAIISYITTNSISSAYLAPNSIMQGRLYGLGVMVRW
jgi:hypothetical protein